jgi:hypothetical protein
MKTMLRLIYFIPSWLLFLLLRIFFILLGFVFVPIALLFRQYDLKKSPYYDKDVWQFRWRVMKPWQNFEDGFHCTTYFDHGFCLTALRWTLVRNPANGLRFMPSLSCRVEPAQIRFVGSILNCPDADWNWLLVTQPDLYKTRIMQYDTKTPQWFLCWQGWYSCIYIQYFDRNLVLKRFWIGWKVFPTDVYGVTEYRKFGAGFATQWKVVK